jgi:uncharacterized protein (TIGR03790 family)
MSDKSKNPKPLHLAINLLSFITVLSLLSTPVTQAAVSGLGNSAVVVYNSEMPKSKEVAMHYARLREVPDNQVIGLPMEKTETISRAQFETSIYKPLYQFFKDQELFETEYEIVPATRERPGTIFQNLIKSKIRYLVLCYGVPVRIKEDDALVEPAEEAMRVELRYNRAAVDHELSWFGRDPKRVTLAGPIENPVFGTQKATEIKPENGVMIVGRLDGPSVEIAKGLVDKAMQAEEEGLWGRAYFDARGLKTGSYLQGDTWIRNAAQLVARAGFETVLDDQSKTFAASDPLSHIAFYAGWYAAHVSGPFQRDEVEFMPGAIAYHLHSYSASILRTSDKHWAGPLLKKGATATMGCVYEPYLGATPDIGVFFERLLMGFSFGEAAYASQRVLSWQTTVVGDPLYHPLSKPVELLQMELTEKKSPLLAWVRMIAANQALQKGTEKTMVVEALEKDTLSQTHPALCEKLGDLYFSLNRPEDAKASYERTLLLNPTRNQRNRLLLALAALESQAKEPNKALDRMDLLLAEDPTYPDKTKLLATMKSLAEQSGLTDRAEAIAARIPTVTTHLEE